MRVRWVGGLGRVRSERGGGGGAALVVGVLSCPRSAPLCGGEERPGGASCLGGRARCISPSAPSAARSSEAAAKRWRYSSCSSVVHAAGCWSMSDATGMARLSRIIDCAWAWMPPAAPSRADRDGAVGALCPFVCLVWCESVAPWCAELRLQRSHSTVECPDRLVDRWMLLTQRFQCSHVSKPALQCQSTALDPKRVNDREMVDAVRRQDDASHDLASIDSP